MHGTGLYLGVELVGDRGAATPASAEAYALCERMRELGVIVQPTGDHENVLKIKPPLCIGLEDADMFADTLDRVLRTVGEPAGRLEAAVQVAASMPSTSSPISAR